MKKLIFLNSTEGKDLEKIKTEAKQAYRKYYKHEKEAGVTKEQTKSLLIEIMNPSGEEMKDWEQRWDKNHPIKVKAPKNPNLKNYLISIVAKILFGCSILLFIWIGLTDPYVASTDPEVFTKDPSVLPLIAVVLFILSIILLARQSHNKLL